MKTKGQIVRDWRVSQGLSPAALAKRVGTTRQSIENLEADVVGMPRYLAALAEAMGYGRIDDLLALQLPPETHESDNLADGQGDPHVIEGAEEFVPTTEEEWRFFRALRYLSDAERETILSQVETTAALKIGKELLEQKMGANGYAPNRKVSKAFGTPPRASAKPRRKSAK